MIVRPVSPFGAKVFDTLENVTPWQATMLAADKFQGGFFYAQVVNMNTLAAMFQAGLWVGFVLEGLAASTVPTADLGRSIATTGIGRLRALGVPEGVTVFSDLENPGHPPDAWIAYGNGAADATIGLRDIPGHYFGEGAGLTSGEMYAMHGQRYAKGASRIVDRNSQLAEPACGWCWVQGYPMDIDHAPSGLQIDIGAVWEDYRGRTITVVAGG